MKAVIPLITLLLIPSASWSYEMSLREIQNELEHIQMQRVMEQDRIRREQDRLRREGNGEGSVIIEYAPQPETMSPPPLPRFAPPGSPPGQLYEFSSREEQERWIRWSKYREEQLRTTPPSQQLSRQNRQDREREQALLRRIEALEAALAKQKEQPAPRQSAPDPDAKWHDPLELWPYLRAESRILYSKTQPYPVVVRDKEGRDRPVIGGTDSLLSTRDSAGRRAYIVAGFPGQYLYPETAEWKKPQRFQLVVRARTE